MSIRFVRTMLFLLTSIMQSTMMELATEGVSQPLNERFT